MKPSCKHCGIRYAPAKGQGEFCCAGCEHVYRLIQDGGFGSYYSQQDRAGQPVGERPFADVDLVLMEQLQKQAEFDGSEYRAVFSIRGMSCLGCAWLIEQLARRHNGVRFAKVSLASNRLSLAWAEEGGFRLSELAEELRRFGYGIGDDASSNRRAVSPLAMRFGLTLLFSLNGLLLLAAEAADLGGAAFEQFYILLIVICLLFALLLGGALFIQPAWRGLLLRRINQDVLPASFLLSLSILALFSQLMSPVRDVFALVFFLALPTMVLVRWRSEVRALKIPEVE